MRNNTNDFSAAKIGDRVYNYVRDEYGTVVSNYGNPPFGLMVKFEDGSESRFTNDGKDSLYDVNPVLFWDKPQIIAPPKPFDLKSFLKERIKPIDVDDENFDTYSNYFHCSEGDYYDTYDYEWKIINRRKSNVIGVFHFTIIKGSPRTIEDALIENEVSYKDMIKCLKELGWL